MQKFWILLCCTLQAWPLYASEPVEVRVLSYNIHHAEGVDGNLDLERIARVIRSANADLVALQEVDQHTQRSQSVGQATELARLTGMEAAFGVNLKFQGGDYGNAVLSRWPIVRSKNCLLPNLDDGEQRGVLAVEIQVPGRTLPLILWATHLDHRRSDRERVASAQAINEWIRETPNRPALLVGDLNDVSSSATLKLLQREWMVANSEPLPTIPVDAPSRQIDFILCRPAARWRITEVQVLDEVVASDHRPILAVLELRADN